MSVGADDPLSAFARSLLPGPEPASSTYELGRSPPIGAAHANTTVRPATVASNEVGDPNTRSGATLRTVDNGARWSVAG